MRLNKVMAGILLSSCTFAATFAVNASPSALMADDTLNIIQGLNQSHMFTTDGGKTWRAWIGENDNKFLGSVIVQVAELNNNVINSVAYDETMSYAKAGTLVRHDGYIWTNGWWANPGEKPGSNGVWKRGAAINIVSLGTFTFTPFQGQQAIDYQKKLKDEIASKRKVVGYYPEWGVYEAHNFFTPDKVAWDQISHLNYGFAVVTADGVVTVHDTYKGPELRADIARRTQQAGVANMVSIGGYTNSQLCVTGCGVGEDPVKVFQAATATPEKVEKLAQSIVDHMLQWQFDGVDIDWEYPSSEQEAKQFTQLMKTLRAKLDKLGLENDRYYQLSAAVTANHNNIRYINPAETAPLMDSVNVMTYDFHGAFDPITGHNSPLYANKKDSDLKFNIDSVMREYHQVWSIPKSKLLVGLAWYGRAWGDVQGQEIVAGQPGLFNSGSASLHGQWDDEHEKNGVNPYYRLKEMALDKQFQRYWDAEAQVPYLYNAARQEFYSWDDVESISQKVDYIKREGYGGAIIWDLSGDTQDHELGKISATLLKADQTQNPVSIAVSKAKTGKTSIHVTMNRTTFDAAKRIIFYVDDQYAGETYVGTAYYSAKKFDQENGTVTVSNSFNNAAKLTVGSEVKVVLAEGKPGGRHTNDQLLAKLIVTEDMLK